MESSVSKILLQNYQDGDSGAASEIHARYAHRLYALAKAKLGRRLTTKVDPDDILQTTFLAFFEKADREEVFWKKEGDLWRLLAAICVNHVKRSAEHYGSQKRNADVEVSVNEQRDFEFDSASQKLIELVESLIQGENPMAIKIVEARLAGFSTREIAQQTGRSERTIRRIVDMLKAKLALMSEMNVDAELNHSVDPPDFESQGNFNASYEDYELLKMLGAGAFGKVYLARCRKTESLVTVKVLRRSWMGNENAEALFLNEANILASISHPNVISFLEFGPLPNGSWFIVMELVEGVTFDRAVGAQECSQRDLIAWLRQICESLEVIHGKGIIHGDLKPENLIVGNRKIKLIDFGFSRRENGPGGNWLGGTTGFVAPEKKSGSEADIYAFGKIVSFALHEPTVKLDSNVRDILQDICNQSCQRDPQIRPTAFATRKILDSIEA